MKDKIAKLKGKKVGIILTLFVLLVCSTLLLAEEEVEITQEIEEQFQYVEVYEVNEKNISEVFYAKGYINSNLTVIGADRIQGKVKEIFLKEGDVVNKGDEILKIDRSSDLVSLSIQVEEMRLRIKELDLSLDQISDEYIRTEKLFNSGAASKNEYLNIKRQKEVTVNQRSQLITQIRTIDGKINLIEDGGIIISPVSGIIKQIKMTEGTMIGQDDLIQIEEVGKQSCTVYLSESNLISIKEGTEVQCEVQSLDLTLKGRVKSIKEGGGEKILYPVEIEIDTDKSIKSGLITSIEFEKYKNEKALLVPTKSIIKFNKEVYIYRVTKDLLTEKVIIEVGTSENGFTEVINGLKVNDRIINKGQFEVTHNQVIRIRE